MKELTIKEKAKAYDEALKVANKYKDIHIMFSSIQYEMFPELKESEDEKMMNQLHSWMKEFGGAEEYTEKVYSWLQGMIEKQDEQKPTKVEPKFKVGDWVVVNDGRIGRIIECTKDFADVDLDFSCLSTRVNNIRPWTIQDAKCGNILVDDLGNICIYQEPSTNLMYHSFCYGNHKGFISGEGSHKIVGTCPATKEQSNLLFQKMEEAGYEWDADKKELKKMEQKPWSEEDENILATIIEEGYLKPSERQWLKSIKDRVQPQPQWKPSDEQMRVLCLVKKVQVLDPDEREILNNLYKQLKKLREE